MIKKHKSKKSIAPDDWLEKLHTDHEAAVNETISILKELVTVNGCISYVSELQKEDENLNYSMFLASVVKHLAELKGRLLKRLRERI